MSFANAGSWRAQVLPNVASARALLLPVCFYMFALVVMQHGQASAEPGPSGLGVRVVADRDRRQVTIEGLDPAVLRDLDHEKAAPARIAALCSIVLRSDK